MNLLQRVTVMQNTKKTNVKSLHLPLTFVLYHPRDGSEGRKLIRSDFAVDSCEVA